MNRWNWTSSKSAISSKISSFIFFFFSFFVKTLRIVLFDKVVALIFSLCAFPTFCSFCSLPKIISIFFMISSVVIFSVFLSMFKLFDKNIMDLSYFLFKFSKLPTFDKHIFSPNLSFISLNIFWQDINLVILFPLRLICSPLMKALTLFKSYKSFTLSLNWESTTTGNIPPSSLLSSSSSFELSFCFCNNLSKSSSVSLFFFKIFSFPWINLPKISLEFRSKSFTEYSSSISDFNLCFFAFFWIKPNVINLFISIPW